MKVGSIILLSALAALLPGGSIGQEKGAQEKSVKKESPKPAPKGASKQAEKAAEKAEKPAAEPATKSGEKPAEVPAGDPAEQFSLVHKKWTQVDTQLNELARQYQLAPSSEERTVLRDRYQKLVVQSEKVLPDLRAAAEAAFAAAPAKDPAVTKVLMGVMAYDYRRDNYEAVLKQARTLLDAEVEEPVIYAIAGVAAYRADDYETAEEYLSVADKAGKLDPEGKNCLTELLKDKELWEKEQAIRAKEEEANDLPRVKLETSKGDIVLELFENEAPQTVGNFISLVEKKFYDNVPFHRVLQGFMAQGGDPTGTGTGGPGYQILCECYREDHRLHFRGALSMAHSGRDTGGSQFYLTFRRKPQLDGKHTVFGRVVEGIDVLARLQRRDPEARTPPTPDKIVTATVLRKREHEYKPALALPKIEPGKAPPARTKSGKSPGN